MSSNRVKSSVGYAPIDRYDKTIEWLLGSLLIFMPLAFGAVQAWSEAIVVALAAAISMAFLLKLVFQKNTNLVWSWSYVPVAVFILVALFQLIPLPTGMVGMISPNTAAVKRDLLGNLPNSNDLLRSMTVSFYPNATKHDLRLVLSAAAVFFVVINVYRRPEQIKRLLGVIAAIGGSIAVLTLAQDLFSNGKIYWLVPTGSREVYSGPFVHHSHYCQFMNLSVGAALGLLMVKVHEAFAGKKVTPLAVFEYLGSPAAKVIWLLVAMIIIGVITVFVSLSRGGMVSLLIAAGFTTLVLSSRRTLKGSGWIMLLLALGAFVCVLYTGFDAVHDRLATLRELHEYKGRWQIVRDVMVAFRRFPMLGTGLGAHEVVYPMFDRSAIPALAAYAENEYAQAAEETGFIGLGVLVWFAIIVWVNYARNIRKGSVPIRSAAYGLGFGLLAIMLHSLSDFGQHLPANAFLSGLSCALVLVVARTGQEANRTAQVAGASRWQRSLRGAALICTVAAWSWVLPAASSAAVAEAHWEKALAAEQALAENNWQGTKAEFANLLSHAAIAARCQPENVKYRHWLNVYRWRSVSRMTDPNTGEIIVPEQSLPLVHGIIDALHKARLLCPTYGATYCVVGQLEKFILNDPRGAERIREGFRLAPCDATACFVAGLLDVEERQIDASIAKFSRAVQLDGGLFRDVADICVNHLDRPDLAVMIAGEDIGRLCHLADILVDPGRYDPQIEQTRAQLTELLASKCRQSGAPARAFASLANIYRTERNYEAAMEHYRWALALDDSQVGWRLTLARLLADGGYVPEAIQQARICLRFDPRLEAAAKLVADLSVHEEAECEQISVR